MGHLKRSLVVNGSSFVMNWGSDSFVVHGGGLVMSSNSLVMNGSGVMGSDNSFVVHGLGLMVGGNSLVMDGGGFVMNWGGGVVDGSVMNLSSLMGRSSDVLGLFVMNRDGVMGVLHKLGCGVCWHFMVGNMSLLNSVRAR